MEYKDDAELPVTRNEMNIILQPMLSSLERMEMMLQDLSNGHVQENAFVEIDSHLRVVIPNSPVNARVHTTQLHARNGTDQDTEDSSPAHSVIGLVEEDDPVGLQRKDDPVGSRRKSHSSSDDVDEDDAPKQALEIIDQLKIRKAFSTVGGGIEEPWVDKSVKVLKTTCAWLNGIEEPHRKSIPARVVNSGSFETCVRVAIIVNSILVACNADWQIKHIGENEPKVFSIMEAIFFTFFTIELLLRILTHRCYFFMNSDFRWNIMDFVLVAISIVDFTLSVIVGTSSNSHINVAFMRLLRFLKLARILRSLRSLRFFKSLTALLESFANSFTALFWGFVMLFFVLYLFALIFLQAFVHYLDVDHDVPYERVVAIKSRFGSLSQALLSLYMGVTGGLDWGDLYELLKYTGTIFSLIFVFFTFFFLFAIFNILTGSLVEKAMSSSKPDRNDQILSQRKAIRAQKAEFLEICREMDFDKSGTISWAEFEKWLDNPVMLAYMETMGIDIHDAELFFSTVGARTACSGKLVSIGEVTIEHFVEGCMNMKGSASAIDMQRNLFELHIMHHDLMHDQSMIFQELETLGKLMREHMGRLPTKPADAVNSLVEHLQTLQQICREASGA